MFTSTFKNFSYVNLIAQKVLTTQVVHVDVTNRLIMLPVVTYRGFKFVLEANIWSLQDGEWRLERVKEDVKYAFKPTITFKQPNDKGKPTLESQAADLAKQYFKPIVAEKKPEPIVLDDDDDWS